MSISQLLQFNFPPRSDGVESMDLDNNSEFFSTREPTTNIEDLLLFLALPNHSMLQGMVNTFGQAWFDSNKSLQTWLNPEIAFPFWVLTYWGEMLDACKAHDKWVHAAVWLRKRDRTAEKLAMRHTVEGLWSVLGWHGNLRGFGSIEVLRLADFFSEEYLGSGIVDALLSLLSFRLTLAGESITGSNDTLMVDTTFAQFLELLLPVVDARIREHKDIWKNMGHGFRMRAISTFTLSCIVLPTIGQRAPSTSMTIEFDMMIPSSGKDQKTSLTCWVHGYMNTETQILSLQTTYLVQYKWTGSTAQ
ncbi:hypothetical protein B0H10DRAFT_1946333 [Mycena sp. CBHHK59/15]|nr:hypothetical protein B0H10DRAFT_1946333 [Mycena sp. CBHHK59/15]